MEFYLLAEGLGVFAIVGEVNIVVRLGKVDPLAGRVPRAEPHGALVVYGGDPDFHEVGHGGSHALRPSGCGCAVDCEIRHIEGHDIAREDF